MNPIKRITQSIGTYLINRQPDAIAKTIKSEFQDEYFGIGEYIHLPDGFNEAMNAFKIGQLEIKGE